LFVCLFVFVCFFVCFFVFFCFAGLFFCFFFIVCWFVGLYFCIFLFFVFVWSVFLFVYLFFLFGVGLFICFFEQVLVQQRHTISSFLSEKLPKFTTESLWHYCLWVIFQVILYNFLPGRKGFVLFIIQLCIFFVDVEYVYVYAKQFYELIC